ncbi:LysE family translocator [uncultured Microbacterium sp.]|uniref:LysE family translocator n=1 Tax=uncultured Microbacterium sp. TaxID=191216 RepID=UPI00260AC7AD|nr:LysE family translocator [uncultured Microbacterium sp.]
MTIGEAILGFTVVAAMLTVIPGLDTTLVLRSALVRGRADAFATALGIVSAVLLWGAAAAVGAAALLAASEVAYRIVTIGGAAYMAYLGASMIMRSFTRTALAVDETAQPVRGSSWRSFGTGVGTNLLNPKIGVFYIATIPHFIPPDAAPLAMGLLLALVHDALGMIWFALIIFGAVWARKWLASARSLRIIDRIAGSVLIGFGAKLALEQR